MCKLFVCIFGEIHCTGLFFISSTHPRDVIEAVNMSNFLRTWNNQDLPVWNAVNDVNSHDSTFHLTHLGTVNRLKAVKDADRENFHYLVL